MDIFYTRLAELAATDLAEIRFGDPELGSILAYAAGIAVLITLARLLLRRRHSRHHSGHNMVLHARRGIPTQILYHSPKLLAAAALIVMLFAAADPYLTDTEAERTIESRVRIDLIDVSSSMLGSFYSDGSDTVSAQVARDAHLDFLKMREGEQDRTALWLFGSNPYKIDDFVVDDELYFFQVHNAPYAILSLRFGSGDHRLEHRIQRVLNEGSTQIIPALNAVIQHFDDDAAATGRNHSYPRSLLILTDANVQGFPSDEMDALVERNITPYMIFVNEFYSRPTSVGSLRPVFVDTVREHGGEIFAVGSADALGRAYEAIDQMEAQVIREKQRVIRTPIFDRLLLVGILLMLLAIPAGLLAEMFLGVYP